MALRESTIQRKTQETDISLSLNLDGTRQISLDIPVPFFPHLVKSLAFFAGWDLAIKARGDLEVDCHHTVEDLGIVLGMGFRKALEKGGNVLRFGSSLIPMDEALSQAVIDLSGRSYFIYKPVALTERVGNFEVSLIEEFLRAMCMNAHITLHVIMLWGNNSHHCLESLFKAIGQALGNASQPAGGTHVLSTKGTL